MRSYDTKKRPDFDISFSPATFNNRYVAPDTVTSIQQFKRNSFAYWTVEEEEYVLWLLSQEIKIREIAKLLDRSKKAVQMRLERMLRTDFGSGEFEKLYGRE